MNRTFTIIITILFLIAACQGKSNLKDQTKTEIEKGKAIDKVEVDQKEKGKINISSLESQIQFIRDRFSEINNADNYKIVPFEVQCDERSSTKLDRKYNKSGDLMYLQLVECGGHGCKTRDHYYWDGELIFIYYKDDFTPGNSHIIEEHRTYFNNGEMIQCLEKKVQNQGGEPPIAELLKKAKSKKVDCAAEKKTAKLSELENIRVEKAKKYFCPNSQNIIGSYNSVDCSKIYEKEPFSCECNFLALEEAKGESVFVWNMDKSACIKVGGELNALYPDWEERDYKKS